MCTMTRRLLQPRIPCIFLKPLRYLYSYGNIREAPIIESKIDKNNVDYKKNEMRMRQLTSNLRLRVQHARHGGSQSEVELHLRRGKLRARERIDLLLDPASPFLELSQIAGHSQGLASAGLVTGVGVVCSRWCMLVSNDATVKGGSYSNLTIKKHLRAQEIAKENQLPCIYLVDSGGSNLIEQSTTFPDKDHFGRIFLNQAQMSSLGIPQIAICLGSCTGGSAFIPALADESIGVNKMGSMYLAGPPLVKAVLGQDVEAEQLGGAQIAAKHSGLVDHLAVNELEALKKAREVVANCNVRMNRFDTSLISIDEPLVDGSRFDEFKTNFGSGLTAGFATIHNLPVAILAASGPVRSTSALKATHFIQLCDQRNVPLLFVQNVTGFMIGAEAEHAGVARHAAALMSAVATAKMAKLTLIIGGGYGASNYAFCGRSMGPALLFVWPNAKIAVMGGHSAANALLNVKRKKRRRNNDNYDNKDNDNEDQLFADNVCERLNKEAEATFGSSLLWDDGIIEPLQTRKVLAIALNILHNRHRNVTDNVEFENSLRLMRM